MNPTQHVSTLRQTHRAATSMLPVLTATLTVAGAVIAAMEARSAHERHDAETAAPADPQENGASSSGATASAYAAPRRAARVTVRGYLATLVGHVLMVTLGIALVLSLTYVASASGRVGQAILLTALILLALYLTEKIARRA